MKILGPISVDNFGGALGMPAVPSDEID